MKFLTRQSTGRLLIALSLFLVLVALSSTGAGWVDRAQAAISLPAWCPSIPTVPTVPVPTVPTFPDVTSSHWGFEYVETLAYFGYVSGFPDGNYYPDSAVLRDQMAVFIERADKGTSYTPAVPTVAPFPDVPLTQWAVSWIAAAKNDGFVGGFPDGNYYPSNDLTRAEASVYITKLVNGTSFTPPVPTLPPFPDVLVSHWAASWIAQAKTDELVAGYPDGNYHPENPLTRAEMAVVISRALCLPGFP